ncbi:hypothetical protein JHK85_020085 [Glycine max]|nr:hypothetical protein JHK85_020085 [Glycine max]
MWLFPLLFSQELSVRTISKLFRNCFWIGFLCQIPIGMSLVRKSLTSRVENVEDSHDMSVLDLPELALDCILERLPPLHCVEWPLEWKWHVASKRNVGGLKHGRQKGLMRFMSLRWPLQWIRPKADANNNSPKQGSSLPVDSVMNWYLALESGNFWFLAQVYNRENGHIGFLLSCYDAELSYDPQTDTFQARYPPHGRRAGARECGIPWERLRAPPIDTSPHDLHFSDYQTRPQVWLGLSLDSNISKHGPPAMLFGWSPRPFMVNTVVLEFNHYTPGSQWRQTTISRKDHREEGNEADGFYGGIRKIKSEAEITTWKHLWPLEVLE